MQISSKLKFQGKDYLLNYSDVDTFKNLDQQKCTQMYGVCFFNDKIVVGRNGNKGTWNLIGGTIEQGETLEQALIREIQEESNMKILKHTPIGVQEVTEPDGKVIYQLRSACIVEPYGDFIEDPAGSVTEIKLIDPKDYKQYFDWGEIGERIIERAVELKPSLENL